VLGVSSDDSILLTAKYGSAEGLTNELKHSGSCVRLLAPDELGNLLAKCAIEHSSFPTFLTTAFYRDQQRGGTKKEAWEIDCRLSIAGGVVEENFGDAFQAVSTLGLYDRFLFGLCPQPYNYEYYPCERAAEDVTSRIVAPEVDRDVWEVRDEWRKQEITGRVAENALRAAYICAAVDGRKKLRGSDLGPAFELAKYQAKVRDILKPNPGKNHDAQCGIAIMDWLRLRAPNGDWVKFRTVSKGIHAERYGPGVYMRSLLNLSWQGEIETDSKQKIMRLAGDVL
jgi:hypothetical protein